MDLVSYLTKEAEASNTELMPVSEPIQKASPKGAKAVINKTAEESYPDDNLHNHTPGEQPAQNTQSGPLKPHVSTEGKEPPKLLQKKEAQHYALPSQGRYPLDAYDHVIKAASYFGEWGGRMEPQHRREFCENLVKRAGVLGIPVSGQVLKYGSATYAPQQEIDIALEGRKSVIQNEDHREVLDKLAERRPMMSPDNFAATLEEFDKVAGISHYYDEHIMDPYYSTYGFEKNAESTAALDQSDTDQDQSFVMGNETVSAAQLKAFAATRSKDITDTFGEDFTKEFRKDPVGIFSSLPMDQKKIICRQANDNSPS